MSEPLIIIPGDDDQARGYRITKWGTFINYECIYCQYASLWQEKMVKHQANDTHPWAYPSASNSKLSDHEESELEY